MVKTWVNCPYWGMVINPCSCGFIYAHYNNSHCGTHDHTHIPCLDHGTHDFLSNHDDGWVWGKVERMPCFTEIGYPPVIKHGHRFVFFLSFPVKFPPPQDPAWEDLGPWRAPVETQPEDPSLDLKVSVNWTGFMLFFRWVESAQPGWGPSQAASPAANEEVWLNLYTVTGFKR